MSLEGKVAFVSGSSRPHGIGRSTALALARDGADVAVHGFGHMEGAEAVAEEIRKLGRKSVAVKIDVRDAQEVQKGLDKVKKELGPVSILVNNAAQMGHFVPIYKATVEEFDNEVKICLNSAFYCIKAVWKDMCDNKWGRVVNISSVAGVLGGAGQASYGSSKAGLINLAKTVAIEGARFNITGNAVVVGLADTDAPLTDEATATLGKRLLWKRAANPAEIADAIAYLVSDEAKYMTGATMNMMGGLDLFVV
ncbi:MAG: SDR family oxidoreductase [Dehalococcoidia bacterium]|jgi:3-oxoacyl-[acyl-carrier protein] reductase